MRQGSSLGLHLLNKWTSVWLVLCLTCLTSCINTHHSERVALQPLGGFNEAWMDSISVSIEDIYGLETVVRSDMDIPKSTFINVKSPRYRADKLLKFLNAVRTDTVHYIQGLTMFDISTTKHGKYGKVKEPESKYYDWGIFGLGQRPGTASVVSTFRLKNEDNALVISRLRKVCVHEIGHNMGLKHCDTGMPCVMKDAVESIKTIDGEPLKLCAECQKKVP